MEISVTAGTGEGPNPLVAFDRALYQGGIANFNLLVLSSVIPPGSTVREEQLDLNDQACGARLYVVLGVHRERQAGMGCWAGIGWIQDEITGAGMLVEHGSTTRDDVERLIDESVAEIMTYRRGRFGPPRKVVTGTTCRGQSTCSLVAAVFQVDPWP